MNVIKVDLPQSLTQIELHTFADEHIGDDLCDIKRLKERIDYVKNTPNAYCILNGDILDNATRTSIGDTYTQTLNPMEQLQKAVDLFGPISNKTVCFSPGNHELRTYRKEGINLSYLIASQLGIEDKYTPASAIIFLRFGKLSNGKKETNGSGDVRKVCYSMQYGNAHNIFKRNEKGI